jgi:hypothetical protein
MPVQTRVLLLSPILYRPETKIPPLCPFGPGPDFAVVHDDERLSVVQFGPGPPIDHLGMNVPQW